MPTNHSFPYLVAESVAANDNGLLPGGDEAGHVLHNDGLAEHRAVENVADGPVGRLPHLLQVELCVYGCVCVCVCV